MGDDLSPFRASVQSGGRLEALRAIRDRLAFEIENPLGKGSEVAALAARLVDVLEQIAALEKASTPSKGTVKDELAAKRAGAGRPVASRAVRAPRKAK